MVDVLNIHYFEKEKLKLYGINILKDGVYKDYQSFANQTPINYKIEPIFRDSILISFKASDINTNRLVKIKNKDAYAIVINGQPYVSAHECYLPIYKKNGEYQFVSIGNIESSTFFTITAIKSKDKKLTRNNFLTLSLDITDQVIANSTITMTIDHLNGEYIPTPENASASCYFK